MPSKRLTRDEKKAATRQALLAAAATLIARHGAEATSLDRIAEHAGYTKGAVYSNFRGKEELLFALAEAAGSNVTLESVDGRAPLGDQLAELGRIVARSGRTVSRAVWRLHLELFQYALRNDGVRARLAAEEQAIRQHEGARLAAIAADQGLEPALTGEELATVLSALSLGLVQKQALDPDGVPDELFARAFRLLVPSDSSTSR